MSELRQDPFTKEWVIIATERAKRPEDFKEKRGSPRTSNPAKCPFCPGHESKTPPEILVFKNRRKSVDSYWQVRVIPNKYQALTYKPAVKFASPQDVLRKMDGIGAHEVIIETPDHTGRLYNMPARHVEDVLQAFKARFNVLAEEPGLKVITIFKNYGEEAGSSLTHSHSQLIATPIVPTHIRLRLSEAQYYYDTFNSCVFCDILQEELRQKERIVMEDDQFVVLEPFAAKSPFETLIFPKKHASTFGEVTGKELAGLARVLPQTLGKIYVALNDPDYNFYIRTAPFENRGEGYYHWYLHIVPKVTQVAGFEIGSGIHINITAPEDAARYLRKIKV